MVVVWCIAGVSVCSLLCFFGCVQCMIIVVVSSVFLVGEIEYVKLVGV